MTSHTDLHLPVPPPFDFSAAAYSHGWVVLPPFAWEVDTKTVRHVLRLSTGRVVQLSMQEARLSEPSGIRIEVESEGRLAGAERQEIREAVGRMFRLEEDFSPFYELCRAKGPPWDRLAGGLGRLLRAPSLFEDVIKTICTTNIQWAGTKAMVHNLVTKFGEPYPRNPKWRAFPTPQALAEAGPETLAAARLGYRAGYVSEFARQVASGELDLGALEDPQLPDEELRKRLLAIKGVGNYAAHTLLMLLGRYGFLAYDTALRDYVGEKYFQGEAPSEGQALAVYEAWGDWKYLAYWFDYWLEAD